MDSDYIAMESGKESAGRLSPDYYSKQGWKPKSIAAMLVCAILGCTAAAIYVSRGQSSLSPRPLNRAHSAWDQKCQACHTVLCTVSDQSAQSHLAEATCQQCHQM